MITQQARPKDFGPDAEEQTMQLASQLIGGETDSSPVQGTEAEHLGKFRENARKNVLAIQLAAEARASCSVNEEEPLLPKAAAATDEQQPPEPIAHLDETGVMPSKEWQRQMLKASPINTDGLAVKHLPKPPQARPKKTQLQRNFGALSKAAAFENADFANKDKGTTAANKDKDKGKDTARACRQRLLAAAARQRHLCAGGLPACRAAAARSANCCATS